MTQNKILLLFLISILIGYGQEIGTFYIALLNPGQIEIIENQVAVSSCDKHTDTSVCNVKYALDLSRLKEKYPDLSIGSGMIISATRYICNHERVVSEYDDYKSPGRNFHIFNTFQTYFVDKDCSFLEVEAWGHKESVRKGKVTGLFVAGNTQTISLMKESNEFFSSTIYQVFAFCFLFLSGVSFYVRRSFPDLPIDEFDRTLPWWVLSAFFNTGVVQIFIPFSTWTQWQNRVGAIVLLTCLVIHYSTSLFRVAEKLPLLIVSSLAASSFLMFDRNFAFNFVVSLFSIGIITLPLVIRKKSPYLGMVSFLIILGALKVQYGGYLPNPMVVYFFVGLVALQKLELRLSVTSGFSLFLNFISNFSIRTNQSNESLSDLVDNAKQVSDLPYITMLRVHHDGKIEIYRFHETFSSFIIESIPPVFAHAISLRSEIWHLTADAIQYKNIVKNSIYSRIKVGDYFSVIPIYDEEVLYGAIAVTGYASECIYDGERAAGQRATLRVLASQVKAVFKSLDSNGRNEWSSISDNFLAQAKAQAAPFDLSALARILADSAEASVFIAALNKDTERFTVMGIHGFNPFVQERLTQGSIYAKDDNLQGPIALAANKGKAIIVHDVTLLKEVLHENSIQFFEKNETKSCAGIPIFIGASKQLWGVLWLERRGSKPPITLLAETPLVNIANFIGQSVENVAVERSLKSFIPNHLYEQFVHSDKADEFEHGYIVMIDLKGSTKVALEKGSAFWREAVARIYGEVIRKAERLGLKMQEFKWDAFYFTISSETLKADIEAAIVTFVKEISPEIENWNLSELATVSDKNRPSGAKLRVCVSYGDCSRGILNGEVRAWGFKGSAVAAVTKLEDACKKIDGVVFFDDSALSVNRVALFEDTSLAVPGTERKIFRYAATWDDFMNGPTTQRSAHKRVNKAG